MRRVPGVLLAVALLTLVAPTGARAQTGQSKPVVGGGSFNTALPIEPGTYSDTLVAGETNFYRVRLEKGQRLSASVRVDASAVERDSDRPGYDEGLKNLDYALHLWTPIREPLDDEVDGAGVDLAGDDEIGVYTGRVASRRVLGFDQVLASEYNVDKLEAPGDYYVEVTAQPNDVYDPPRTAAEFPVELDVRVTGQAQESSSNFAEDLPSAAEQQKPAGGGGGARPASSGGAVRASVVAGSGGPSSDPIWVYVVFGAFALASGAALGAALARLRPA